MANVMQEYSRLRVGEMSLYGQRHAEVHTVRECKSQLVWVMHLSLTVMMIYNRTLSILYLINKIYDYQVTIKPKNKKNLPPVCDKLPQEQNERTKRGKFCRTVHFHQVFSSLANEEGSFIKKDI